MRAEISRQILIADDDPDDRLLFQEAFHELGVGQHVRFTANGEELLATLSTQRSSPPGLIILDLNMPRMDGRQALTILKGDPEFKLLPVIIVTTSTATDDVRRSYAQGVSSYFSKPATFGKLVELLDIVVNYWLRAVRLP